MNHIKKIWHYLVFGTYGMFAIANLIICLISGIFLAFVYDPDHAYQSVTEILIFNPAASFIRNMHYWSAQFVFIFTILHIWQHLRENAEIRIKKPVWFRLLLTFFIVLYLMVSGFILKGDADSVQAQLILKRLINVIPFANKGFSDFIAGNAEKITHVYLHHIITATVILLFFVFEHARTIWGKLDVFIVSVFYVVIFSLFLTAPLHNGTNPVLKGPWYLTGLQEILHYFGNPVWVICLIVLISAAFYFLPYLNNMWNFRIKKLIYLLFFVYAGFTITGFYFRGENWELRFPWQKNYLSEIYFPSFDFINPFKKPEKAKTGETVRTESCLACHEQMEGLSPSHNPEAIGCAACHQGNIFSMRKKVAHRGLIKIPGNLETARLTCGTAQCHPDITARIATSLMTTLSGIISIDRYALNESPVPSVLSNISELKNSPADIHLKNLCTQCHLGKTKIFYGQIKEGETGGGCLACHLNYSDKNLQELTIYEGKSKLKKGHLTWQHPTLDLNVNNTKCFSCHSRSGRISLSYEGWYETELKPDQAQAAHHKVLKDGRVLEFKGADIHHEKGLLCIDCHTSYELMGDGQLHLHKELQVQVACSDCHSMPPFKTISADNLDRESSLIASLRNYKTTNYLMIKKTGMPLLNTFTNGKDSAFLVSKNNGISYYLKPPSTSCTNNAHRNLNCESCHTPRVARCIGCHNDFNPVEKGLNYLTGKPTHGKWTEFDGEFVTDVPTLGVSISENSKKIVPLMPGMIMTAVNTKKNDTLFKRLYAPANPHNTIRPAPNCKNCHLNPITYGYGKGELKFVKNTDYLKVEFIPYYIDLKFDHLPADALIPFRKESNYSSVTRISLRPFNREEQNKILLAGSCLICHPETSSIMRESLNNFEVLLSRRKAECLRIKQN